MLNRIVVYAAALASYLATGCSSVSSDDPFVGQPAMCPEPGSGTCLGELEAGTYTTQSLRPQLTYTVPDEWSTWMTRPGSFCCFPGDCTPATESAVGLKPRAIVQALRDREGLETSEPR
jgi:hypothetical protein